MKVEWKDISTFSQSDKERKPRSFEARIGKLRLSVHRHIHYEPDDWLMDFGDFGTMRLLKSKDIEDAKREASDIAMEMLSDAMDAIQGLIESHAPATPGEG